MQQMADLGRPGVIVTAPSFSRAGAQTPVPARMDCLHTWAVPARIVIMIVPIFVLSALVLLTGWDTSES
jgi:hypothetical protein